MPRRISTLIVFKPQAEPFGEKPSVFRAFSILFFVLKIASQFSTLLV